MRERTVEERLTPSEVAARLKINVSTVWRAISAGKIKPVEKLGRRTTRIPAGAVNRWLEACRVT